MSDVNIKKTFGEFATTAAELANEAVIKAVKFNEENKVHVYCTDSGQSPRPSDQEVSRCSSKQLSKATAEASSLGLSDSQFERLMLAVGQAPPRLRDDANVHRRVPAAPVPAAAAAAAVTPSVADVFGEQIEALTPA
eukprot:6489735-Amphidinium_carterae.1